MFLGVSGTIILILMVITIVILYTEGSTQIIIHSPLFWQVAVLLLTSMIVMGIMCLLAYMANVEMRRHRGLISSAILRIKHDVDRLTYLCLSKTDHIPHDCEETSNLLKHKIDFMLQTAQSLTELISALETIDEVNPAKVAGFTIERHHIVWVLTTMVVLIYSMISFVSEDDVLL